MLVHSTAHETLTPAAAEPQSAAPGGQGGLWEGSTTGMAASTLALTPLTVQQNVPSIGEAQRAPKTKVDATLEQGEGRAPGWKWGWMRKNIPFAPVTQMHKQRPFGPLRTEYPMSSAHPPGTGREQFPIFKEHKKRPTVLAGPETVYYTAAAPPTVTWTEPL